VRVPDDISVVGFDDLPDARHFLPPLTTVRQDFQALGTLSIELLLAAIAGEAPQHGGTIPAPLVVRESTAPRR
jgi:DNA-binding LacI/PurR family transcriptional regulator